MGLDGCPQCFGPDAEAVWSRHHDLTRPTIVVHESHFTVVLRACTACGQRFVLAYGERINWHGGNDELDALLVPVTDPEADALVAAGEEGVERALGSLTPARRHLLRFGEGDPRGAHMTFRDGAIWVPPHD